MARLFMKLKTITFAIIATLLVSSCMKEGDFSELKHPIIFEGDFDPVLGIPFAKMSGRLPHPFGRERYPVGDTSLGGHT